MENKNNGHNHVHSHMKTLRKINHLSNAIEIETTYKITINGVKYNTHIMLGNDGALTTHAIPYRTFESMTDLIKALIELYPDEFNPTSNHHHHHGH
mgnify:CR=1 FL=1